MTTAVPSRTPAAGVRPHVAAWLSAHADVAVRLLAAPPGYGKTTALAALPAPGARRRVRIIIDGRLTLAEFVVQLTQALAERPVEIVLDDVQLAGPEMSAELNAALASAPPDVFFVIATQRRDAIDIGTLFVRGRLAVCDQSDFALDAADTRGVLTAHGLDAAPAELQALVTRCDGWPPAIAGTARELAAGAPSAGAAYERWLQRFHLAALDLIDGLIERLPNSERAAARRRFSAGTALDQSTLAMLHRCGFFVRFTAGTFALMHWVDELAASSTGAEADPPILEFELFGRFRATLRGTPIVWARRRDQHIVKYLLLAADGSATRAELAGVFWPQTARPLALQNLRTACSTIRRAIGSVAGVENVDRYLVAGDRLAINQAAVSCDVDRFRRLLAGADDADAVGSYAHAVTNLRAAERLYGNGLFAGDGGEPMFAAAAAELAALYAGVLARLSEALLERGSVDLAREYAAKAAKLRPLAASSPRRPHVHLRFLAS
jgi:hypothetical protein